MKRKPRIKHSCSTKPHSFTVIQQTSSATMRNVPSKSQLAFHVNKSIKVFVSSHDPKNNRSGPPKFQSRHSNSITKTAITNTESDTDVPYPAQDGLNFQPAPTNPGKSSRNFSITKSIWNSCCTSPNPTTSDLSHPLVVLTCQRLIKTTRS